MFQKANSGSHDNTSEIPSDLSRITDAVSPSEPFTVINMNGLSPAGNNSNPIFGLSMRNVPTNKMMGVKIAKI